MTLPKAGQWLRWLDTDVGREGQILSVNGVSMVVRWLGVEEPQVFPWGLAQWPRNDMEVVPRPSSASRIDREKREGRMGIATAAALLGTTPKRVRQKLRDGQLEGRREKGRWVEVELPRGKR